jgi:hypothetical protein
MRLNRESMRFECTDSLTSSQKAKLENKLFERGLYIVPSTTKMSITTTGSDKHRITVTDKDAAVLDRTWTAIILIANDSYDPFGKELYDQYSDYLNKAMGYNK